MARYITTFKINQPESYVQEVTQNFFRINGYEPDNYKGAKVWRKGMALVTVPRFMDVSYLKGEVKIEAWVSKFAFPGLYLGESGVTGFVAIAIKQMLKGEVSSLTRMLTGEIQAPSAAPAQQPAN